MREFAESAAPSWPDKASVPQAAASFVGIPWYLAQMVVAMLPVKIHLRVKTTIFRCLHPSEAESICFGY